MVLPRKELPDIGELVVGTVREIHDFGAYLELDEYGGLRAFLPWSEVSSRYFRDIREVIREGQKVVVKVIRVDRVKKTVDASLKKVTDSERQKKITWWKRFTKACKIIEMAAKNIGKSVEDAYREVTWPLLDKYYDVMYALEEAAARGSSVLVEAGVPEYWIKPLLEEARKHVKVREVVVRYNLVVQSFNPRGVEEVKACLSSVAEALASSNVKFDLYTAGSPRYLLEVYAQDYKVAESYALKAIGAGEEKARELGAIFKAEREKK
ncbi:MAG: translation initiation factor IF-2 subunit alpha [Desulfurococcaceae archaeon]